jgi:hypothetical protein
MLKKEKPMMTVAAIIEQAQNRWMEHPLVYNRSLQFQGSYCKYYLFHYSLTLFTPKRIHFQSSFYSVARISN